MCDKDDFWLLGKKFFFPKIHKSTLISFFNCTQTSKTSILTTFTTDAAIFFFGLKVPLTHLTGINLYYKLGIESKTIFPEGVVLDFVQSYRILTN